MVALDSSYLKTSKATPSSSFCTVYYQRYSDYKNYGERWRPSWIFPQKSGRKKWKQFFQSVMVNISDKSQFFKIYMKTSQNDTMTYTIVTKAKPGPLPSRSQIRTNPGLDESGTTTAAQTGLRFWTRFMTQIYHGAPSGM